MQIALTRIVNGTLNILVNNYEQGNNANGNDDNESKYGATNSNSSENTRLPLVQNEASYTELPELLYQTIFRNLCIHTGRYTNMQTYIYADIHIIYIYIFVCTY